MSIKKSTASFLICFILLLGILPLSAFGTEDAVKPPDITSPRALVYSINTGKIIYEKNIDEITTPASTTKLMTALVVAEKVSDLSEMATVSQRALDDSMYSNSINLKYNEKMSVKDLLAGMMIASGNDAANVLAEHAAGSIDEFVVWMNEKAKALGMSNTRYTNPTGLHSDGQSTTVRDVLILANAVRGNEALMEICTTTQYQLAATNKQPERWIKTTNHLTSNLTVSKYKYEPSRGMNAGSTSQAGNCIVSTATTGDVSYLTIVMGAEKDNKLNIVYSFVEAKKLFEWAYSAYDMVPLLDTNKPLKEIGVRLSKTADHVLLIPMTTVNALLPVGTDVSRAEITVQVEETVDAPIEKGQILGTVTASIDGEEYGTTNLIAQDAVERTAVLYYLDNVKKFFGSTVFKVIIIVIIVLAIVYFLFVLKMNRSRRGSRYRKVRRRRNL